MSIVRDSVMGEGGGGTPGFCIEHLEFIPYDSGEDCTIVQWNQFGRQL